MEYNRMVEYIYSYNDGQKCKNTGFAKIEVRQDILKLQINMKGAYSDNDCEWNVNLFYRKNSSIIGVALGNMVIRNGVGEFRYAGNALNLENSGISFDSIKGLYIEKKSEESKKIKALLLMDKYYNYQNDDYLKTLNIKLNNSLQITYLLHVILVAFS